MKKKFLIFLAKFIFNRRRLTTKRKKLWTMACPVGSRRLSFGDSGQWTRGGFTLIELLITLLLIAIISTVFLGLFKRGGLAWQLGERRVEFYQNARVILSQLSRELSAVYVSDTYKFLGGTNQIEFFANIWSGESEDAAEGIVKLGYKKDGNVLDRLYVVDPDPNIYNDWNGAVKFAFYFNSITFQYDGFSSWDSSAKNNTLPSKIDITVTMGDEPHTKSFTTSVYLPGH